MQCFAKRLATAFKSVQGNKGACTNAFSQDLTDDDLSTSFHTQTLLEPTLIDSTKSHFKPFTCQIPPIKNVSLNKPVQSVNGASTSFLCHLLNTRVLDELDANVVTEEPPSEWVTMHQIGYSPAKFNLGLWYQSHFPNKPAMAEFYYRQAYEADGHPEAAYNLACLLMKQNGGRLTAESQRLMQHSSDSGVKEAIKFISSSN
ncbi:hypothetical protein Ciccas_005137 [Cichlidogyrus casuarinus]|uniref:Uncharacterized protein n=1 Tax=Cichlidogyrus casuarinus TaxID=1844966 RepID=A0ABD2Q9K6_9PLAT